MEKKKKFSISLTTQILVATIGGLVFGVIVGPWASNIKFIGDIFLRLIQMSVVLLVMSAVAGAVGGGDGRDVGKMGFHTFKWIIGFTIFSAALGVVLAMLVKPGIGIDLSSAEEVAEATVGSLSSRDAHEFCADQCHSGDGGRVHGAMYCVCLVLWRRNGTVHKKHQEQECGGSRAWS